MKKKYFYCTIIFLAVFLLIDTPQTAQQDPNALTDVQSALLDTLQFQTFNYFWQGREPVSGCARERIHLDNQYPIHPEFIITTGGTGFGIMALIVGIERGFISRKQGFDRMKTIVDWLDEAQRYHGAWSHWYYPDGFTFPFSRYDDGGDLVETAFLAQGLLTARQYFREGSDEELALAQKMDELWRGIDWNWYTRGSKALYWHWSPYYDFKMNMRIRGHNECLVVYLLAAASPDHAIDAPVFQEGYMRNGGIYSGDSLYGIPLILDHYDDDEAPVGPLFWAHYSHLGLDPRGLTRDGRDFWEANRNHAMIHFRHSVENPYEYRGYNDHCWGLTSSYSMTGYSSHHPTHDLGVIAPTAALSSFPYTPEESTRFLEYLYTEADSLVGKYGPYDAFSFQSDWYLPRYLSIDQLPIPVMVENYRTGLLWELFMSAPEVGEGLKKLAFEVKK